VLVVDVVLATEKGTSQDHLIMFVDAFPNLFLLVEWKAHNCLLSCRPIVFH
jgi:hypothetical protein